MVEEKEVKEDGGRVGEEEEGVSKLVPTSVPVWDMCRSCPAPGRNLPHC